MRGATPFRYSKSENSYHFNPRTPCGVRQCITVIVQKQGIFQSTHPMRGATRQRGHGNAPPLDFNPRTPCGVRHALDLGAARPQNISIHAPHAGCDLGNLPCRFLFCHFNPRTPCGVRRRPRIYPQNRERFQSTHPMRGATDLRHTYITRCQISIHAPLAGCDYSTYPVKTDTIHFNPRTPCGVRLNRAKQCFRLSTFQSTHPMRGATRRRAMSGTNSLFQSTHPVRGAT